MRRRATQAPPLPGDMAAPAGPTLSGRCRARWSWAPCHLRRGPRCGDRVLPARAPGRPPRCRARSSLPSRSPLLPSPDLRCSSIVSCSGCAPGIVLGGLESAWVENKLPGNMDLFGAGGGERSGNLYSVPEFLAWAAANGPAIYIVSPNF